MIEKSHCFAARFVKYLPWLCYLNQLVWVSPALSITSFFTHEVGLGEEAAKLAKRAQTHTHTPLSSELMGRRGPECPAGTVVQTMWVPGPLLRASHAHFRTEEKDREESRTGATQYSSPSSLSLSLSHIYTETTQDLKCPVTVTRSVPESEVQNEWKLQRRFLTRKFWSFLHPLDGAMVPTTGWWWWILSNERERLNIITLIYTSNIPGAYRSISIRLFCRFSLFTELKPKPNQLN